MPLVGFSPLGSARVDADDSSRQSGTAAPRLADHAHRIAAARRRRRPPAPSHRGQCAVAFIVTELEQAAAAENAEKQRQQCATPRAAYTRLFQTTCRMTEYCGRRT